MNAVSDVRLNEDGSHEYFVLWETMDNSEEEHERWELDTRDHFLHYHYHTSEGASYIQRLEDGGFTDYTRTLGPLQILHRSKDGLLQVCWDHTTDCIHKRRSIYVNHPEYL